LYVKRESGALKEQIGRSRPAAPLLKINDLAYMLDIEHTNLRCLYTLGKTSTFWQAFNSPAQNDSMIPWIGAQKNQLLAALSEAELDQWRSQLEVVEMPLGQVLYESGGVLDYVYFPTSAIVSMLYVLENGSTAEIAVVGNEGLVGISLFIGGESTCSRAVVQSAGQGFRLPEKILNDEFHRAGPVLQLLLRYTQALITQMAQTAICNRHHTLSQQLCRWLLLSLDRVDSNELQITQELIANMLGVRRETVTDSAHKLQSDGVIKYVRGRITVLDRPGLEQRSCECYGVVKREYERLLPVRTDG